MRILHTIHSMSPEGGGPSEGLRRLAETALAANAYETEVVCLDAPDERYLQSKELRIHAVGPGWGKYGYTRRLDRWFEENLGRFDGVVINGIWQYHAYATWKASRGKVPYMIFTHGMLDPWFKHAYPVKHLKKMLYWNAIEWRVLRDALGVMFTASLEAELAQESFGKARWKSIVVPYGTLAPTGDSVEDIQQFYEVCPQVAKRPFILFLGRLHEKKGCDLLIQAFARSADLHPQTHLVIAGPDQQGWKAKLVSLAAHLGVGNRVHFPGMLQAGSKWGAFRSAEVFALPSHQENFGIAVAEALACGTPVLISNKVNIWHEVVAEGVGLVDEDTLDGTCRLLDRWRAMPAEARREMAARCRGGFERCFDLQQAPAFVAALFAKAWQQGVAL